MLASVVIPAYNVELLLERAIRSILQQDPRYLAEIIVVDDCSTDNTLDIVRQIPSPLVRVIEQPCNRGAGAARNRGLMAAMGRYVAFLDGDDYWLPDFLLKTVTFLEGAPVAVGVSVGQMHKRSRRRCDINPRLLTISGTAKEPVILDDFFSFWAKHNHVCTGAVLMRTETARQIGGQREDLRISQDLEFWAMLGSRGRMGFIPEILFVSDGSPILAEQGARKYKTRLRCVPTYEQWFSRLRRVLSDGEKQAMAAVLARVVVGTTVGLIHEGRFREARLNVEPLAKLYGPGKVFWFFAHRLRLLWFPFCFCHRRYFYIKVNWAYWMRLLRDWLPGKGAVAASRIWRSRRAGEARNMHREGDGYA